MSGIDFNEQILTLLQRQNDCMEKMSKSLERLTQHIEGDDVAKPFPDHGPEYEPAWQAVLKTKISGLSERVEQWRSGMDVNLVFIALFVAVVSAFQVPISVSLSADPADTTNDLLRNLTTIAYQISVMNGLAVPVDLPQPEPFVPARSDEIITLFWNTSLILSILTAILTVFGRQWVNSLQRMPESGSYFAKVMHLKQVEKFADKLLQPILDILYPVLISSIASFVIGFLYQLWTLSVANNNDAVLTLTSSIASGFALIVSLLVIVTLAHGVRYKESPFASSLSETIQRFFPSTVVSLAEGSKPDDQDAKTYFVSNIPEMTDKEHLNLVSSVVEVTALESPDALPLTYNAINRLLQSDTSLRTKITVAKKMMTAFWSFKGIIYPPEYMKKCRELSGQYFDIFAVAFSDTPRIMDTHRRMIFQAAASSLCFGLHTEELPQFVLDILYKDLVSVASTNLFQDFVKAILDFVPNDSIGDPIRVKKLNMYAQMLAADIRFEDEDAFKQIVLELNLPNLIRTVVYNPWPPFECFAMAHLTAESDKLPTVTTLLLNILSSLPENNAVENLNNFVYVLGHLSEVVEALPETDNLTLPEDFNFGKALFLFSAYIDSPSAKHFQEYASSRIHEFITFSSRLPTALLAEHRNYIDILKRILKEDLDEFSDATLLLARLIEFTSDVDTVPSKSEGNDDSKEVAI